MSRVTSWLSDEFSRNTGIAELDAGLGVETTPDELMDEISVELGLEP